MVFDSACSSTEAERNNPRVSIPRIPGFTGKEQPSLATLWQPPPGNYPAQLWPRDILARATPNPIGWVVIEEHFYREEFHGGTHAILANKTATDEALRDTTWAAQHKIGDVQISTSHPEKERRFTNGLTVQDADARFEFFVDVKEHHGFSLPTVEITHPFLWYWGAFPTDAGWSYLDSAGRNVELVRAQVEMDAWRVEVEALALRTYLADAVLDLIVQLDYVPKAELHKFGRLDDEFANDWAHLDWHALTDSHLMNPTFSRLLGQYVVRGQRTTRVPMWDEPDSETKLPEFVYGVDPTTGALLKHTCDPDELGTYFDQDDSRLHYLTPINFSREVLGRYAAEPNRYTVTSHRISCLNLWGLEISSNTAGLIEAYLGDLGKLPASEHSHWLAYNVPPEGDMEEGRFRRDFLNQFASSPDQLGDLRHARNEVNRVSREHFGESLWRDLDDQTAKEFDRLVGPTTNDPSSLVGPILTLVKALVDGINVDLLKSQLGGAKKGEQSIALLTRWVPMIGLPQDAIEPIAALQAFRSAGGVAHLAGSRTADARARLGIDDLAPWPAFIHVVAALTDMLTNIATALSELSLGEE